MFFDKNICLNDPHLYNDIKLIRTFITQNKYTLYTITILHFKNVKYIFL